MNTIHPITGQEGLIQITNTSGNCHSYEIVLKVETTQA